MNHWCMQEYNYIGLDNSDSTILNNGAAMIVNTVLYSNNTTIYIVT